MKQLKFMLAAATALGLATASQAGVEFTDNFDTRKVDGIDTSIALTTPVADLGYTYDGTGENYSEVVAADDTHNSQMLHVDTDGTPLIRSLGDSAYNLASYESVYIDTMVKFTATPIGDTVTATPNVDKLMIYLQATNEVVTAEDGTETTNDVNKLMVKSGSIKGNAQFRIEPQECTINNYTVAPNKWYRLVVTAFKGLRSQPQFKIEMCDPAETTTLKLLTANEEPTGVFTSLIKTEAATISSVGFAGEGWIDDLAFGTVTVATSVDFTFTGDYLSSVTYTIGTDTTEYTWSGEAKVLEEADSITIKSIAFSGLYKVAENSAVKVGSTHDVNAAGMEFAVTSAELTGEGETAVPAGTTASQIGITNDAFAAADNDQLNALVKWAKAANKGSLALINSMTFDANGYPSGDGQVAAEAYLLDCAPGEVETEKGKFKLSISFNENGAPVVEGPDGAATYKNGNIVLEGRESLSEEHPWGSKADGHKFFRAFLKK